jgi:hypothetical protein
MDALWRFRALRTLAFLARSELPELNDHQFSKQIINGIKISN